MPKVKDHYKSLDPELMEKNLALRAGLGIDDWDTTELDFIKSVWNRDINLLTRKQVGWLIRIAERYEQR